MFLRGQNLDDVIKERCYELDQIAKIVPVKPVILTFKTANLYDFHQHHMYNSPQGFIYDIYLNEASCTKFLGVQIYNKLSLNQHMAYVIG